MSDELIIELIAAIKAAIADGRGELTPKNLRRRLCSLRPSSRPPGRTFPL